MFKVHMRTADFVIATNSPIAGDVVLHNPYTRGAASFNHLPAAA